MADAKKCDHCGAFYDPNIEQGYQLTRDSGPEGARRFGLRYEWDLCSAACLETVAAAEPSAPAERRVAPAR